VAPGPVIERSKNSKPFSIQLAGPVEAAIYWFSLNQLPLEMHVKHFLGHLGYASILEKVEAAALRLHLGVISNRI